MRSEIPHEDSSYPRILIVNIILVDRLVYDNGSHLYL